MCIVYLPDFICAIKKVELYVVHPYVYIIYIYILGDGHQSIYLWWCIHPCVDFHLSSSIVILEWIEHPWKPHIHPYVFYFRMLVIYCNIIYLCTYHIYIMMVEDGWSSVPSRRTVDGCTPGSWVWFQQLSHRLRWPVSQRAQHGDGWTFRAISLMFFEVHSYTSCTVYICHVSKHGLKILHWKFLFPQL